MGAAFGGVLAVDKRIEIVARLPVDMGESSLKVAVFNMDERIEAFAFHVVLQQVEQSVFGIVTFVVVNERETPVQVGVVPNALFNVFVHIVVVAEKCRIWNELYQGAAFVVRMTDDVGVADLPALFERNGTGLATTEKLYLKFECTERRKRKSPKPAYP